MRLSLDALSTIYATETGDYPILLITVRHPDLAQPLKFSTDATTRLPSLTNDENIVYGTISGGNEYIFCPMEIDLPTEDEEAPPSTIMSVSNVGREMVTAIRSISPSPKPTLDMALVLASNTDMIEGIIEGLQLSDIDTNQATISGELVLDILTNEPCPYYTFTPSTAPGLFK